MSTTGSGNRITDAFANLDTTMLKSGDIRDVLIKKLYDATVEFEFDIAKNSAESRESFMAVVNGLDGLLKGRERIALENVKLSLLQRSESDNHSTAAAVTQLLHMINPALVPKIDNNIDPTHSSDELEKEFIASGHQITDSEAEQIESGI